MKDNPSYITKCFIAASQLANVVLFKGWPDEMLSARAYRQRGHLLWDVIMLMLDMAFGFIGQIDHCKQCYEWEKRRYDSPVDYKAKK